MPGLLKQTNNRSDLGSTRIATHENLAVMANEGAGKRKYADFVNGDTQSNGGSSAMNGVYANGVSPENLAALVEAVSDQFPPEIEHITQGYLPLSKLVTRLAQDTFSGLTEVINEMADMQPAQSSGQPHLNGAVSSQASQINVQKKARMWDFANDRRAKFIKVLVLSQWSRQAESVSKVIDLNYWLECQKGLYRDATSWVGELKRLLGPMKLPSPDLKTALEALSTGKAEWLPSLSYLRPEPLSPAQLLKALRTINTLLTIRLNLHEEVPVHLKNFTIASGRVKFCVKDEFELDLSIGDEDPSSQFFFIDFRFLFSPCMTEIPEGRTRDDIVGKTNEILKAEGLSGCYDFLHDLVLTHKLRVLTSQAVELARGRWSENITIEPVRRSVVVQYWLNRPGGKNWVEIGIRRGKPERRLFQTGKPTSRIALRWHRNGKEVVDPDIEINLGELSMESILKEIITLHTNHIFRETKRRLKECPIYSRKLLSVKHRASTTDPTNCSLRVQFTSTSTVEIVQEPVSGAFALVPPSSLHGRAERELNALRDPAVEAFQFVANLRCTSAIEQAEKRTTIVGWQTLKTYNPNQDTVRRWFGPAVTRVSFFKPTSWTEDWLLALTTSMAGDSWWVVETRKMAIDSGSIGPVRGLHQPFQRTFRLSTAASQALLPDPGFSNLANIEATAAAVIAQYLDCQELENLHVRHIQLKSTHPLDKVSVPDLYLRFKADQVPLILGSQLPAIMKTHYGPLGHPPWCHEVVKSCFKGLSRSRDSVTSVICGRLIVPISNINKLTSTMESTLAFHPNTGAFGFRLTTPIGQSSVPALLERFDRIERLVRFLEIIRRYDLQCEAISLSDLTFTYATDSVSGSLKAKISFASDAPMDILFAQPDPHLRIQDFLASMLNSKRGFEYVALVLRQTLPLMRAFAALESVERNPDSSLHILPRSATSYRVKYENPYLTYEIKLRQRNSQPLWYFISVKSSKKVVDNEKTDASVMAWDTLCRGNGPGWQGLKGGIKAELEGVEHLVSRIDEVVRELAADNTDGLLDQLNATQEKIQKEEDKEVVVLD